MEGCWARGKSKIWERLLISATVEASNFKFGTELQFGTSLPKTMFKTKIGESERFFEIDMNFDGFGAKLNAKITDSVPKFL